MKKLAVLLTALMMLLPTVVTAKEWTETVKCGQRRVFEVNGGDHLQIHKEDCGGSGLLSRVRPEFGILLGPSSSNMSFGAFARLGLSLGKSWELVGDVAGRLDVNGYYTGQGSVGAGLWANNNWRAMIVGGESLTNNTTWNYQTGGLFAGAEVQYAVNGRKASGVAVSLQVRGGPWHDWHDQPEFGWSTLVAVSYLLGH